MSEELPTRPVPAVTPESARYWAAGLDGQLLIGSCDSCGRVHHPPQAVCPHCWSPASPVAASGRGRVAGFSVVHRNGVPAFQARLPYVVAYVELDEGVHLTTNLVDCDPEAVVIGMPVRAVFEQVSDEVSVPLFAPEEDA